MTQIIPAILATSEEEYYQKLKKIESIGSFQDGWVQIDLMDNKFVQNKSIGPDTIAKYPTNLKLEAQLMVEYPENWIDELVKINIQRIVFPYEDTQGIESRLLHIKNHQIQAGLSINPQTPVDKVVEFIGEIDVLLIMSVEPGFGGQEFISGTVDKVKQASALRLEGNFTFKIEVDGGVKPEVAKNLAEAGADYLVVGSHLLEGSLMENLEKFWQVLS